MPPYLHFILKEHPNKKWLFIAIVAAIVQFTLFKWLYPFGDYFIDSYSYLGAAVSHAEVSYRPIGYTRFLCIVHTLTTSETALTGIQYLLLQLGALHLFFSVLYFYKPGKKFRLLLFVFLLFNPLTLYLANYVSSDALFTALSLFWFIQLLWTLHRPGLYQLPVLAALLYLLLQTRFTALYYPLPAMLALVLLRQKLWYKITGAALFIFVAFFCIFSVQRTTEAATGTKVFSAFGGWQWANNAMHIYCHVRPNAREMPARYAELDSFVRRYFDTACPRRLLAPASTDYMWDADKPLKQYMDYYQDSHHLRSYFVAWTAVGPIYSGYGRYLAQKYPVAFTQYYLWPSTKMYLLPSLEVMLSYNQGVDTIDKVAKDWFRYPGKVTCVSKRLQTVLLAPFPLFFLLANLFFAAGGLWFLRLKGFRRATPAFSRSLLLVFFFFILNAVFSIVATPASSVRYSVFPLLLLACFTGLIFDWLYRNRPR